MELRILGPFQVFDDSGREVGLPAGRERALLAALVLRRAEVVSVDALVEALWGDTAPSTPRVAVVLQAIPAAATPSRMREWRIG